MKLSIYTTVTNPGLRGDNWEDAFECYSELADELVVVDGSDDKGLTPFDEKAKYIFEVWPKEFNWKFFGEQFQRGYEACTGDWVLRADLDYIFHEDDFQKIREAIENNANAVGLCLYKYQFILPDRYNLKSRLVTLVNKGRYGDRIRFDGGGDLCQATFDGKVIKPDDVPIADVPIYNYEKLLKTKKQIADDVSRMERAWHRYFGEYQYGSDGTPETAYSKWVEAQVGKFHKPQKHIKLKEHPKFIQETIKNLKPINWGYSGHGILGVNDYVK